MDKEKNWMKKIYLQVVKKCSACSLVWSWKGSFLRFKTHSDDSDDFFKMQYPPLQPS